MMQRMASRTIDNRVICEVLAVVDENRPEVDKDEEGDIGQLLQREEKGKDMVRQRLREAIERVEGMASVGRRHDPLVMRLVKVLVDEWVVQIAMNPVDAEVGEDEEDGELGEVVPKSRAFIGRIVELAVSADFEAHQRGCAERHERHGLVGLNDLEPDLVLDELGVVQGTLVEDEDVRERRKEEVDEESENPDNKVQCNELTENIVARPCAHVGRLRWLNIDELARRFVCPGGEGLARVGGDALGEVIGSRECWVCPGIDIVGDEGIGELENDIHLEWVDRERRVARPDWTEVAVLREVWIVGVRR